MTEYVYPKSNFRVDWIRLPIVECKLEQKLVFIFFCAIFLLILKFFSKFLRHYNISNMICLHPFSFTMGTRNWKLRFWLPILPLERCDPGYLAFSIICTTNVFIQDGGYIIIFFWNLVIMYRVQVQSDNWQNVISWMNLFTPHGFFSCLIKSTK